MGQNLLSVDPGLASRIESLTQAKAMLEDTMYDLRGYAKDLNLNPEERDEVESRLSQIKKLQKKHGVDSEGLMKMLSDFESEIDLLQNSDERLEEMKKELKLVEKNLRTTAEELHRRRVKVSNGLAEKVNDELSDLNMKGVHFLIAVTEVESVNATGLSFVEFQIQNSKKDEPRAINKFASGGELSRILLSLKRVLGPSDRPRTYLFDEVDTGVSGQTAERVGRKLREISKGQQVICVTHLPQVAAFASHHFLIEKGATKKGVAMDIKELKKDDRVKEIARLISGEKISASSLEHARSLLKETSL
jgi:DNA repair protein RecN (Recombination protein N)